MTITFTVTSLCPRVRELIIELILAMNLDITSPYLRVGKLIIELKFDHEFKCYQSISKSEEG